MQSLSAGSSNQLGHFFIKLHPVPFYSPVPLVILQCRSPILNRIPKNRQQSSRIFRDMFFFGCSSAVSVQFQCSSRAVSVQFQYNRTCTASKERFEQMRQESPRILKNPQESQRISESMALSAVAVAFQWHSSGIPVD